MTVRRNDVDQFFGLDIERVALRLDFALGGDQLQAGIAVAGCHRTGQHADGLAGVQAPHASGNELRIGPLMKLAVSLSAN